jgi:DNA-binding CsgD family transcriptional regulator
MGDDRFTSLSNPMRDYLRLTADLMSSKDIAILRGVTEQTVKNALSEANKRLGVTRRSEAARMFREFELQQHPAKGNGTSGGLAEHAVFTTPCAPSPRVDEQSDDRVCDETAPFDSRDHKTSSTIESAPLVTTRSRPDGLTTLEHLASMAKIFFFLALAMIAILGMSDGFQRLANFLHPTHH